MDVTMDFINIVFTYSTAGHFKPVFCYQTSPLPRTHYHLLNLVRIKLNLLVNKMWHYPHSVPKILICITRNLIQGLKNVYLFQKYFEDYTYTISKGGPILPD